MKPTETTSEDERTVDSSREVEVMASVLEGRHGVLAVEIAEFLVAVHEQAGDALRAAAWYDVALTIRRRELARTTGRQH
jgi:hypothetical protein